MEVNSSNVTQVQPSQPQPQQQQVNDRRAFEDDLASQQQAQQSAETTPAPDANQNATTDYTSLIREARAVQATPQIQAPTATSESSQNPDVQHIAVAAYQSNRETYEAPTPSGELLPRLDAIV